MKCLDGFRVPLRELLIGGERRSCLPCRGQCTGAIESHGRGGGLGRGGFQELGIDGRGLSRFAEFPECPAQARNGASPKGRVDRRDGGLGGTLRL